MGIFDPDNLQGKSPGYKSAKANKSWALSIEQKFGLKFGKFHVPVEMVHSGCTDLTQAAALLIHAQCKHNKKPNQNKHRLRNGRIIHQIIYTNSSAWDS